MRRSTAIVAAFGLWQTISASDVVLVPIMAADPVGLHIRDTSPQVTLQNQESLLWGQNPNGSSFVVNITLATGQDEMVISMDAFSQALKDVTCNGDLALTFNDNPTYMEAIREWDWVNGHVNRSLVMVVNWPGCGQAEARQPWAISAATYTNTTSTIDFTATQQNWTDVEDSLKIEWGPSSGSTLSKRDSPHVVSVAKSFPSTLYSYSNNATGLDFTLGCNNCGSKGNLDFSGSADLISFHPSATVTAQPVDIEFDLDLTFGVSGDLVKPFSDTKTFLTVPIDGFTVVDVLKIGPSLDFSVGYDFSGVQGSASIGKKITAGFSNSAIAQVDLSDLGSNSNKFTGWDPTFTIGDWDLDAEIDVELELYAMASLEFTVSFLKHGAGVGLSLKIPDVNLKLEADYNSNGGVCPGTSDDFGVNFSGDVAVDLKFDAFLDSKTTTFNLLSKTITTLPSFCTGLSTAPKSLSISGYVPAATTSTTSKPTSTSTSVPVKPSSSAASVTQTSTSGATNTTSSLPTTTCLNEVCCKTNGTVNLSSILADGPLAVALLSSGCSTISETGVTTGTGAVTTSKLADSTITDTCTDATTTSSAACSLVASTMYGGQITKNCLCGNAPGAVATMSGPKGVIFERCVGNGTYGGGATGTIFTTVTPSVIITSTALNNY